MSPTLSVVIPAFNVEGFLDATVRSVLAQTLTDLEVIVVDDGSTDGTLAAARRFADRANVVVLSRANAGVSAARNLGAARARGRYLAFLDADDVWHPDKAARHVALLDERSEIDLTWSDCLIIDEDGRDTGRRLATAPDRPGFEALLLHNFTGCPGAVILRAAAFAAAGDFRRFPGDRCEDLDMWLRVAALREGNAARVPGCLVGYRRRAGQASGDWRATRTSWEAIFEDARALRPAAAAAVEREARSRLDAYLAYLAYAAGERDAAARLLARAGRRTPRMLGDARFVRLGLAQLMAASLPSGAAGRLLRTSETLLARARLRGRARSGDGAWCAAFTPPAGGASR